MKQFLKKICCSLMKVLGVAAVGASVTACYGMPFEPSVMYGTPTVDLEIAGQVLNEKDEPIEGIEVSYSKNYEANSGSKSDANGIFCVRTNVYPRGDAYLYAKDVDGAHNGSYQTDSVKIDRKKIIKVVDGEGTWD